MSVKAMGEFVGVSKDAEANFHGARVVYFGWDQHLMFYAPVTVPLPPTTTFNDIIGGVLPQLFSKHPEFADIDWDQAQWSRNGEAFSPDREGDLNANGIAHKTIVRFKTPGLNGLQGSGF